MFARAELIRLYRDHASDKVLSLYLHAGEHDPAMRKTWRLALGHAVDRVRTQIDDATQECDAFERAFGHLEKQLSIYGPVLPERGWVGFATAQSLLYAESLPVTMPDLARWKNGPWVSPYVRALPQAAPVVTVLVDSRQAKLYRYRYGAFEELPPLQSDAYFGDLSDNVNMSKRGTTHSGVRGMADTDAAHRFEQVGVERLLKHLTEVVAEQVGGNGTVVVGGPAEITAAALQRLPKTIHDRVIEDPTIDFHTPAAQLKQATEAAGAAVTARRQQQLVDQVTDLAGAGGRGCLGRTATDRALVERRVEVLLVTRRLEEKDPDYVERCVDAAFEQDATVEDVVGPGAARLDQAGQGIAARLRYTI